jgi:uncharacterized membrane protein
MKEPAQPLPSEPRWPVALTALVVLFLVEVLPGRLRVFPTWVPYILAIALIVPMAALNLTTAKAHWFRIERAITLLFFVIAEDGTVAALVRLLGAMVRRSGEIGGNQLLTSSIATWVINVLTFSLLYWQMDRGGPEFRRNDARPDWFFPQEGARDDLPFDWRPTFVDYLYLAYSTATAFSSSDVSPLTSRAKMLLMLQSAISLVTIVAVVSRAINILGT